MAVGDEDALLGRGRDPAVDAGMRRADRPEQPAAHLQRRMVEPHLDAGLVPDLDPVEQVGPARLVGRRVSGRCARSGNGRRRSRRPAASRRTTSRRDAGGSPSDGPGPTSRSTPRAGPAACPDGPPGRRRPGPAGRAAGSTRSSAREWTQGPSGDGHVGHADVERRLGLERLAVSLPRRRSRVGQIRRASIRPSSRSAGPFARPP